MLSETLRTHGLRRHAENSRKLLPRARSRHGTMLSSVLLGPLHLSGRPVRVRVRVRIRKAGMHGQLLIAFASLRFGRFGA